jgi:hypothetical protein
MEYLFYGLCNKPVIQPYSLISWEFKKLNMALFDLLPLLAILQPTLIMAFECGNLKILGEKN